MIFIALLQSYLLGFAISAVPGAVFFETIRRTISSRTSVLHFLVGNFIGIAIIILLVFFGLSSLSLEGMAGKVFYLLSGLVLLWIGISALLEKRQLMQQIDNHAGSLRYNKNAHGFLEGIILAVVNPVSILFWISIMGSLLSEMTMAEALLNGLAILIGAATLFIFLVLITIKTKNVLSDRLLQNLNTIFGGIIVLFGLVMLFNIFI